MDIQTEQMNHILRTHFSLPQPIADQCENYFSITVDYWKLVDMLVENFGIISKDGKDYIPVLKGKQKDSGMQRTVSEMMKSGSFKLSFRSWKKINYCLIKEQLI